MLHETHLFIWKVSEFRPDNMFALRSGFPHERLVYNIATMKMYCSLAPSSRLSRAVLCALLLLACWLTPSARAGLTFTVDLYVSDGSYVFYTPMVTNTSGTNVLFGTYNIYSPGQPTNGSFRQFTCDTNGFNVSAGNESGYTNLASALQQITNGTWTMQFVTTNNVTNTYHFTVSVPGGLSSNQLPVTTITFPINGSNNVTNLPTFTWQGQPTNWPVTGTIYVEQLNNVGSYDFYDTASVPTTRSNWTVTAPIPANNPNTYNIIALDYATNYTGSLFVASTPVNITNSQSISGWAFNSTLESGGQLEFYVAAPPSSSTNHTLVAHYAFDNSGFLGQDSSTNSNSLLCASGWNADVQQQFTPDAVAGGGAVQFFGDSSLTPCGGEPPFTKWTNTLAGSFTVSAWIKTTTVVGNNTDLLNDYTGQNVIYQNNNPNSINPIGITGTKAAFETGVWTGTYGSDTLHSTNSITTGNYVHVVVTRDAGSGLKQIFVNGVLDSSDYGEAGIFGDSDYDSIGGELSGPYTGKLDDVQIYSGVLDAFEITNLYANPGTTAPNGPQETPGSILGNAVNAPNLTWTTYGDTNWYVETTNTYNGMAAAVESGVVQDSQTTTLQTTVVGPGNGHLLVAMLGLFE